MNFGLHELLGSCLALLTLPVFFLAPGYLLASMSGLLRFRQQSWIERSLWACALSLPLSLLFTVHPGLGVSPRLTTGCFLIVSLAAIALALRDWRRHTSSTHWDHRATTVLLAAFLLIPYVILSAVPIEFHGSIYESAIWQDWNIRIQLVNAAIRGGNSPGNPMFAPHGQPASLHYYYFWYVLCARMHDLVRVSARSILCASCVGSALSLLAFLLLAVKYLSPSAMPVRRQATAALLAACILGLDIFPFSLAALRNRFYSDLQFWLDERSPGFLHMVLWSPHHAAGLVCCGLATLLFLRLPAVSTHQQWLHAALAGICFAASAGTSTFITLLFACACVAIFLDCVRRRAWTIPRAMLVATVVSSVLIAPFLHGLLMTSRQATPASLASSAPAVQQTALAAAKAPPLTFNPRYSDQSRKLLWLTVKALSSGITHRPQPGDADFERFSWGMRLLRPPYMAVLFFCEFGFFFFVLLHQIRKDLVGAGPMSRPSRMLWLVFGGIAVPGFLLSSGTLQGNNDFGRHAGFCLRLILVLWSAPLIADFLARMQHTRKSRARLSLPTATRWAVAFAAVGLVGQLAQIVLVRVRFALTNAGLVSRMVVEERIARPAFRFGQFQRALAAAAAITPADGVIQGNPHSRFRNVLLLYTDRQMAALDDGCNVPFGGDPNLCLPMSQALIELYGGMGPHYQGGPSVFYEHIGFNPAAVTANNFTRVCSTYGINTFVVTFVDPIWWDKQSWAWQLHPVFANSTARVFSCDEVREDPRQPLTDTVVH